ncbi:putative DIC1-mitochondrial dicarboxylate carrier protein [Meredithblackwellia eburnea MCA 4105]
MPAQPQKQQQHHYPFYLGGLSGVMAAACTHPVDRTKYLLQVSSKPQGMLTTLLDTARTRGIRSLWDGVSASVLRQATYSTARFQLYDMIRDRAMEGRNGPPPVWLLAGCAGVAGGLAGLIGNPCEIVLVRMCTDIAKPIAVQYQYSNGLQGLYLVARDEGSAALYRGVGPNVIRSVIMNVSQLAAYDSIKRALLSTRYFTDNVPLHLTCGLLAGTIATTLCAPVDVLKSRVQSAKGPSAGLLNIISTGFKTEGPMFFMRGWLPAWVRLTPNTVLMFVFLEQLKRGVDYYRGQGRPSLE